MFRRLVKGKAFPELDWSYSILLLVKSSMSIDGALCYCKWSYPICIALLRVSTSHHHQLMDWWRKEELMIDLKSRSCGVNVCWKMMNSFWTWLVGKSVSLYLQYIMSIFRPICGSLTVGEKESFVSFQRAMLNAGRVASWQSSLCAREMSVYVYAEG